jgi:hypothetical protein
MSWVYRQRSGEMVAPDGTVAGVGYSGYGDNRNDPEMQSVRGVGPIPQGGWTMVELLRMTDSHGPFVIRLEPMPDTETYGRSGFLIHGDSIQHPGMGSHGCIILPRSIREAVWKSGDRSLNVEAGEDLNVA